MAPDAGERSEAEPRVRIVVVDHDGGARTREAIERLVADPWPAAPEIVVVDNASTPALELPGPGDCAARVEVRRSSTNLGFAGGCNLGIGDLAGVDHVVLVNNDVDAPPGWLRPLVARLDADPGLGAVNPKVLLDGRYARVELEPGAQLHEVVAPTGARGRVHLTGRFTSPSGAAGVRTAGPGAAAWVPVPAEGGPARLLVAPPGAAAPAWREVPLAGPGVDVVNSRGALLTSSGLGADAGWLEPDLGDDAAGEVPLWTGSAVVLRAAMLREIGTFDEELFLYYEDLELAWRGRRAGWRFAYEPSVVVRHEHAATAGEGSALAAHHIERNRLLVLVRHAPWRLAVAAVCRFPLSTLSYAAHDVVRPLLRGQRPTLRTVARRARSYAAFLRRLPGALRQRRADRRRYGAPRLP